MTDDEIRERGRQTLTTLQLFVRGDYDIPTLAKALENAAGNLRYDLNRKGNHNDHDETDGAADGTG